MELKTYSRGRAAVAAAHKALDHLAPFVVGIEQSQVTGDRFSAVVEVKSGGGKEIADAVVAAGFIVKTGFVVEPPPAPEPEPETTSTEAAPKKSAGNYRKEASKVKGACAMVHEIASAMHLDNPSVKKAEVIEACRNSGVAFGTARTQYQKWLSAKNKG